MERTARRLGVIAYRGPAVCRASASSSGVSTGTEGSADDASAGADEPREPGEVLSEEDDEPPPARLRLSPTGSDLEDLDLALFETDGVAERAAAAGEPGSLPVVDRDREKLSVLKRLVKKSKSLHAKVRPSSGQTPATEGQAKCDVSGSPGTETGSEQHGESGKSLRLLPVVFVGDGGW